MVVTSVRDYLRKMSEGVEKPLPGIHDSSTVSTSTKDNITFK